GSSSSAGGARPPACSARRLSSLLELAALPLGQTTPDAETLIMSECVLKAFGPDLARRADALRLPGRATLLGEEGLGVGLSAQRTLLPGQLGIAGLLQPTIE